MQWKEKGCGVPSPFCVLAHTHRLQVEDCPPPELLKPSCLRDRMEMKPSSDFFPPFLTTAGPQRSQCRFRAGWGPMCQPAPNQGLRSEENLPGSGKPLLGSLSLKYNTDITAGLRHPGGGCVYA